MRTCLALACVAAITFDGAAPGVASRGPDASARRPNILLVVADDWCFPHAGAYGDRTVKTPAFDRIAREGALFSNSFTVSPSCMPWRPKTRHEFERILRVEVIPALGHLKPDEVKRGGVRALVDRLSERCR